MNEQRAILKPCVPDTAQQASPVVMPSAVVSKASPARLRCVRRRTTPWEVVLYIKIRFIIVSAQLIMYSNSTLSYIFRSS